MPAAQIPVWAAICDGQRHSRFYAGKILLSVHFLLTASVEDRLNLDFWLYCFPEWRMICPANRTRKQVQVSKVVNGKTLYKHTRYLSMYLQEFNCTVQQEQYLAKQEARKRI